MPTLQALRQAVLEAEDLLEPEVLPPKMVKSGGDGEGVHPVDTKMRSSWQAGELDQFGPCNFMDSPREAKLTQ